MSPLINRNHYFSSILPRLQLEGRLLHEGRLLILPRGMRWDSYVCAMSIFSDDDMEEKIVFEKDNYSAPSPTEAPSGLDADVSSTTPTLPQAKPATRPHLEMEAWGNLAKIYKLTRNRASTPRPTSHLGTVRLPPPIPCRVSPCYANSRKDGGSSSRE